MPKSIGPKREREYRELRDQFKSEGRYRGREEEVAARIVNKQRQEQGETQEDRRLDRAGRSPDRHLPIDDYDHLTVPEVQARLDRLGAEELRHVARYERRHKHRKGVLEAIARQH
ncbi:MAG: hypothetical protein R3B09_13995 [Nannocystaceae bacterium]